MIQSTNARCLSHFKTADNVSGRTPFPASNDTGGGDRLTIPHYLGMAASHAASIAAGELSPALGGTRLTRSLIRASIDDPAAEVQFLRVPDAVACSVQSYERLENAVKNNGMLVGLISLPFDVEAVAHQWLHVLHLPTPSKRIADYIGLV
jgi:hypothetical protein